MTVKISLGVIALSACVAYSGVAIAPFLHDDNPAILKNPDVQGASSPSQIWFNDYWGTPLTSAKSHKSYRPFTVLFFRLLHFMWGNWAPVFHVCNIILHAVVSSLFFLVCRKHVFSKYQEQAPLMAGVLFALHPIHTEAVCGVVGCAELLSGLCFMLALLVYSNDDEILEVLTLQTSSQKMVLSEELEQKLLQDETVLIRRKVKKIVNKESKKKLETKGEHNENEKSPHMLGALARSNGNTSAWTCRLPVAVLFAFSAMLCKESGITVLGVLLVMETVSLIMRKAATPSSFFSNFDDKFLAKASVICLSGFFAVTVRLWIMGWEKPFFIASDNPASQEKEWFTRTLTYISLSWLNFGLLIFPINLCYDYSFSTVPLIKSIWEPRNILSLHFFLLLAVYIIVGIHLLIKKHHLAKPLVIGISLLIVPFLPASNLFFPVGFVVAERCLYLPSAGFVILVVLELYCLKQWFPTVRNALQLFTWVVIIFYFVLTIQRSLDWTSKERFLRSGYDTNPNNPKILYNWANYLRDNNHSHEAAMQYRKVIELHPIYASALNNLATILEKAIETRNEAKELYARVIQLDPLHEHAYLNLASILIQEKQFNQAVKVLVRAIKTVPKTVDHATSLAQVLALKNATAEAEQVYFHLLNKSCLNTGKRPLADTCSTTYLPALRNYGDLLLKKGHKKQSLRVYNKAVKLNSSDADTMVGLSEVLLATRGTKEAIAMIQKAVKKNPGKVTDMWRMASTLFRKKQFRESEVLYKLVANIIPNHFEAVGQYAAVLFEVGEHMQAEELLLNLTSRDALCHSDGVWRNLATLYGHKGKHKQAIGLLRECLSRQGRASNLDKRERALVLCELGKHERDRAKKLLEKGHEKVAKELWMESITHLKEASILNPDNSEAEKILRNIQQERQSLI